MLPLSACSLSLFPTSYAMKASIEACFALYLCAQTCHTLGYQLAGIHLGQMTCLCVTLFTWRGWASLCRIPVGLKRFLVLAYSFYWYGFCSHWWIVNAVVLFLKIVVQFWADPFSWGQLIGTLGNWCSEGPNLLLINHYWAMSFSLSFFWFFLCSLLLFNLSPVLRCSVSAVFSYCWDYLSVAMRKCHHNSSGLLLNY